MSCNIWRDTPRALAAAVTDSPISGRTSSRMISPGCTGGNRFFTSIPSFLVVVFKVNILRVFAGPAERDAVVCADAHGPPLRAAAEIVEPVPGHVHVSRLGGQLQGL